MTHCDPDSGETHGSTASMGCLDYSLDLSGIMQDDNPHGMSIPNFHHQNPDLREMAMGTPAWLAIGKLNPEGL